VPSPLSAETPAPVRTKMCFDMATSYPRRPSVAIRLAGVVERPPF
jgi:hypothetical protein